MVFDCCISWPYSLLPHVMLLIKYVSLSLCINAQLSNVVRSIWHLSVPECFHSSSVVVDFLCIVTPIVGVCNCSMFCCTLLYDHFSIAIILVEKGELVALLDLSSWCLMVVERLFLMVPRGCLRFVIVVLPDHTHYYIEYKQQMIWFAHLCKII